MSNMKFTALNAVKSESWHPWKIPHFVNYLIYVSLSVTYMQYGPGPYSQGT